MPAAPVKLFVAASSGTTRREIRHVYPWLGEGVGVGRRKGLLEEVLSRALHADDPELYTVIFRDMDSLREMGLPEFMAESEGFSRIPASRIVEIRRIGLTVYRRSTGEVRSGRAALCPSGTAGGP
ncbi:MAG: hypothetical protein C0167_00760 [Nitrososphaera sp.]|nr:MAG: hypothetical protein C0167_00760 [Nitrososphaera sp.]